MSLPKGDSRHAAKRGKIMKLSITLYKNEGCPLCRQMEPIFESISSEYADDVPAKMVDITKDMQQAVDNGVMSIPTIIIFKDGVEASRFTGMASKEKIKHAIEKNRQP